MALVASGTPPNVAALQAIKDVHAAALEATATTSQAPCSDSVAVAAAAATSETTPETATATASSEDIILDDVAADPSRGETVDHMSSTPELHETSVSLGHAQQTDIQMDDTEAKFEAKQVPAEASKDSPAAVVVTIPRDPQSVSADDVAELVGDALATSDFVPLLRKAGLVFSSVDILSDSFFPSGGPVNDLKCLTSP